MPMCHIPKGEGRLQVLVRSDAVRGVGGFRFCSSIIDCSRKPTGDKKVWCPNFRSNPWKFRVLEHRGDSLKPCMLILVCTMTLPRWIEVRQTDGSLVIKGRLTARVAAPFPNRARTVAWASQARILQGRASN